MKTEKRTETSFAYKTVPVEKTIEYEVYIVNGREFKDKEIAERAERYHNLLKGSLEAIGRDSHYRMFEVNSIEDIIFIFNEDSPEHRAKNSLKIDEKEINELKFPCRIILETQIGYGDYDYGTTYYWKTFEEVEKEAIEYIEEYNEFKNLMMET